MHLAISTKSFQCTIDDGLAHIILDQPDRGNPIDGEFCREFSLCIAEISERADVRSVLISARGRLFSVGGDLMSLVGQGDALPTTIKAWTADLHAAIARMVRMRAPVVAAVHGEAERMARELAAGPTEAYGAIKRLFSQTLDRSLESQLEEEAQTLAAISRTADAREGVKAFVEKRKPVFVGR